MPQKFLEYGAYAGIAELAAISIPAFKSKAKENTANFCVPQGGVFTFTFG